MRCIPKFDFCHNCKVCHRSKGQVLWLLELGTAFACSPNVSYWVHTCHQSAASLSSQSASRRQKESHVAKDKVSSSLLLVFQDCSKGSMQCIHWTTGNSSTFFFSYPLPIFSQLACFSPLPDFSAPLTKSFTSVAPAICASFMSSLALLAETVLVKNKLETLCRNLFWSGSPRVDKSTFLLWNMAWAEKTCQHKSS